MTTDTVTRDDVRDFVASVHDICASAPTPDRWSPTDLCDDRNASLRNRLTEAGWFDIATEPYAPEFLGAAAIELGRALASVDLIDDLLGHGVALGAGVVGELNLSRYGSVGDTVWLCGSTGAELVKLVAAEPVRYIDAQAVAIVTTAPTSTAAHDMVPGPALDAWMAAMTGYIAGLTAGALELAGAHAQQRIAFGSPLTDLDVVANKLADCAAASEGLQMAAYRRPDEFVLAQAPVAACRVTRACHQILGGLGFTLEYPLQRFSRRVEALRAWTPSAVSALAASRTGA